MSNSTVEIKYSSSVSLEVTGVDNRLIGIMAPDTSGTGGKRTQVFAYDCDGFAGNLGATSIDLLPTLNSIGGSPILAMIGSNFAAGGGVHFTIKTDQQTVQGGGDLNDSFSSEQWSYKFVKS